jgi:hypothetical protein
VLPNEDRELVLDAVRREAIVERLGVLQPGIVLAHVDRQRQPLGRVAVLHQPVRAERPPALRLAVQGLQVLRELAIRRPQRRGMRRGDPEHVRVQ